MKKVIALFLTVVLCVSLSTVFAENITILINGEPLEVPEKPFTTDTGRTMVPMRSIFEALGATVIWEADTETIFAGLGDTIITLQINNERAYINDQLVILDAPPLLPGEHTLVPARFVAESLGCTVDWDAATETVLITK